MHVYNHRRDSYPPMMGGQVTESNVGKSAVASQNQTHKRVFWFRHVLAQQQRELGLWIRGFINANE